MFAGRSGKPGRPVEIFLILFVNKIAMLVDQAHQLSMYDKIQEKEPKSDAEIKPETSNSFKETDKSTQKSHKI